MKKGARSPSVTSPARPRLPSFERTVKTGTVTLPSAGSVPTDFRLEDVGTPMS